MNGWPEGGPAPVPDGFEAGGEARPPRNGAESFPEAERCRAKGCTARKARHGVGRCEEHFRTLCGFYGDGNPKAASVRNMNPSEWARVRRALRARAKAADGIGGAGKAATSASAPDAASGGPAELAGDAVREAIWTRNRTARAEADAAPVETAERLAVLPWLADRLSAWPDPWADGSPFVDGPDSPTVRPALREAYRADEARSHLSGIGGGAYRSLPEWVRGEAARLAIDGLAALPEAPDSESGLSLLAAAGERLPPVAPSETRPDPILPVVTVAEAPERTAGRLAFGGLHEAGDHADTQLPLLLAPDGPRVALLELMDVSGVQTMARGRGAPLALRLAVAVALGVPLANRAGRAELVTTVRELRGFLYPNGWERRRHWPAIRAALWRLNSFAVPVDDRGGLWLPFRPWTIPGPGAALDDRIRLEVRLPPGSKSGPIIDRKDLARLGVDSAPRFRAYIAAHSVAWIPGRTRIPAAPGAAWHLWSGDPDKYPVLTARDRDRLAYGAGDRKHRTRAERAAPWTDLPGVEIVTRKATLPDGREGWIVAPEAAADAIRKARRSG